jgi:hypothetical protein
MASGRGLLPAAKPLRCSHCEHQEHHQRQKLRVFEGPLGLCRSQRLQRRYLLEKLHNQDKNIQLQRQHGGRGVGAAPPARQPARLNTTWNNVNAGMPIIMILVLLFRGLPGFCRDILCPAPR